MKWASVRLPQDLYEEIDRNLPRLNATSVSEVARKVLGDFMEHFGKQEVA